MGDRGESISNQVELLADSLRVLRRMTNGEPRKRYRGYITQVTKQGIYAYVDGLEMEINLHVSKLSKDRLIMSDNILSNNTNRYAIGDKIDLEIDKINSASFDYIWCLARTT